MPKQSIALCDMAPHLEAFAVFRRLLEDETAAALLAFLTGKPKRRPGLYCRFVAKLYEEGGDLGLYVSRMVRESETIALRLFAKGQPLPPAIQNALVNELATLTALSALPPQDFLAFAAPAPCPAALPAIQNTPQDFSALYTQQLTEIERRGYGIFAAYTMFTLAENGRLHPVKTPDTQRLSQLVGYGRERGAIVANTKALLQGLPACNILLYGDAGTGKSSTVKALVNEYAPCGLRLVEVHKTQLCLIPALMEELAENPLKFLLFIDDLSFAAYDADFTALKAILEGSAAQRPQNVAVYATSNRRHLLREARQNRAGDEINLADTLEEEASLAARFGLTLTFLKPDREAFFEIVKELAKEYALGTPPEVFLPMAEAQALRQGGRSGRAALQFVQQLKVAEAEGQGFLAR